MKTFETEKGNIPEGATHYQDEDFGECVFAFFKSVDGINYYFAPDYEGRWNELEDQSEMLMDCVRPIPQTKEVEWVNGLPPVGAECEFKYKVMTDADWKFCRVFGYSEHVAAIWYESHDGEVKHATIDINYYEFRKPETPEQKLERERMENGKAYYGEVVRIEREVTGMSFDSFHRWDKLSDKYREVYAMQAEAFNYKVKGE